MKKRHNFFVFKNMSNFEAFQRFSLEIRGCQISQKMCSIDEPITKRGEGAKRPLLFL